MKTAGFPWKALLAWLLAAFFLIGSIGNLLAPEQLLADYARWGYPRWFHYVTGSLELVAAILLASRSLRFPGAVLGAAIMLAASATVLFHGEHAHAMAPLVVLAFSAAIGWFDRPTKNRPSSRNAP